MLKHVRTLAGIITEYKCDILFLLTVVMVIVVMRGRTNSYPLCVLANALLLFVCTLMLEESDIEHTKLNIKSIELGIMNGALFTVFVCLLFQFFYQVELSIDLIAGFSFKSFISIVLFQVLVAVTEELLFRKCLYLLLKRYINYDLMVFFLVSILFALWHLIFGAGIQQCFVAFGFSMWIFIESVLLKSFSLHAWIITHLVYNLLLIFISFN